MKTMLKTAILCAGLFLLTPLASHAAGPFDGLAGQWLGAGRINYTNGTGEKIRCQIAYSVPKSTDMNLHLVCASESYKIDAYSSVHLEKETVSGSWQEMSLNLSGTVSGTAKDNVINVILTGQLALRLVVETKGAEQTVWIVPQEGLPLKNVKINMHK